MNGTEFPGTELLIKVDVSRGGHGGNVAVIKKLPRRGGLLHPRGRAGQPAAQGQTSAVSCAIM